MVVPGRKRVKFARSIKVPTRLIKTEKSKRKYLPIQILGGRIAGPQFEGLFELLLRFYEIPFPVDSDDRARLVSVGEVGVELQCPVGRRDRPVAYFCWGDKFESPDASQDHRASPKPAQAGA